VICPVCHTQIPDQSNFCSHCGATLKPNADVNLSEASPLINGNPQLVREIRALLAGKNCGACGYPTCLKTAEAIARGEARCDACVSVGAEAVQKIRTLTGTPEPVRWTTSLWASLTSVRLALWLIGIILLLSAVGTLVPQNAEAMTYVETYGAEGARWIKALQFDHLFGSWYFLSLLLALVVNTACCTVKRSRVSFGLVAKPMADRSDEELADLEYSRAFAFGGSAERARERVKGVLKAARFRVRESGGNLKAVKFRWGRLGVDLLHVSLVVVLVGGAVGAVTSFEGFQVAHEGETFDSPIGDFQVRVDKLWSESYDGSGRIKDWYSQLTVLEDGREVSTRLIEVNEPLTYKGVSFYQSSFGTDWWERGHFTVRVVRAADGRDFGQFQLDSNGSFYVPEIGLDVQLGSFYADFALDQNMQVYNRSQQLNNPALYLKVQEGGDAPYATWAFARAEMRGFFDEHQGQQDTYRFLLEGVAADQFTGLRIASNPALPVIYGGFALMTLGLFLNFYVPPRWVWVNVGRGGLTVGAQARDGREFESGFESLCEQLREALPPAESPTEESEKEMAHVVG